MQNKYLRDIKIDCAKAVLEMYKRANAGHIGSSLSCLDVLVSLYFKIMNREADRFILSKGHAACALYIVLAKSGRFPADILNTFYQDGTSLAAHPPCSGVFEDIPFGTGSLGHGLSLATGLAFSDKFTKKSGNVFCILSDGDCNEGSTWEAVMFAAQHKLSNLYVFVDANGLQGFGSSKDVMDLSSIDNKFKAFNFDTYVVEDGNSVDSILDIYEKIEHSSSNPKCIICKTTKGNGVSFMKNKMEWHYWPMSDEQYEQAMKEQDNK